MDYDRGAKLDFYKSLPMLQHVVLVYQDQMRVEHYRRSSTGFELEVLKQSDNLLQFEVVDFQLDLAAIYADVPL